MRAVIFDVYGTLLHYWKPQFQTPRLREQALLAAMSATVTRFGFSEALRHMNPEEPPEKTLYDLYNVLIALEHEKAREKDIPFPEVRIERIWEVLIMMMRRHGYAPADPQWGKGIEIAQCAAYFYNYNALGRGMYDGVVEALRTLAAGNIRCGIVSNGQFYTPIDLTLFIRDQSRGAFDDYRELFEEDFVVFSYVHRRAKPDHYLFEKLFEALYQHRILPSQALFAGNDLVADIKAAGDAGMKTALFCGDRTGAFLHEDDGGIVPDLCFSSYADLPGMVSFHSEKDGGR